RTASRQELQAPAIPAAIGAQITRQARRAFPLSATVAPLPEPIAEDLVLRVSHDRWAVSTAQPRSGRRRVLGERQSESHGPKLCSTTDRNNRPSRACARMWGFAMLAGLIWLPTTRAARIIRN